MCYKASGHGSVFQGEDDFEIDSKRAPKDFFFGMAALSCKWTYHKQESSIQENSVGKGYQTYGVNSKLNKVEKEYQSALPKLGQRLDMNFRK